MAIVLEKLKALSVAKLEAPGYYGDGGGLWLQVSKTKTKSWIFRYTLNKKQREMGLGSLLTVSLAEAREKAKACRLLVLDGIDPLAEREARKQRLAVTKAKLITFDQCAKRYIAAHRASWKNLKHASQWENTLATYASPVIGCLPVAEVDTALIVKLLSQIWEEKTETATRLRGRIECILDWAAVNKFRQGDNPARWRGHLDHLLANPNKIAPVKNHPALPWQEIGAFMTKLRERDGIAARAVEFAILTACRSGEVRGAKWCEFDLLSAIWTIPAARMKAGKEHRVPLSSAAIQVLESLPKEGEVVFHGRNVESHLSDMSLTAVLRRMDRADITIHGFRSTFRDWCAESPSNSFSREVCEHALAHSLPDKVEAAYRRGDLLEKRVLLMSAWAKYCSTH
ncbi:tyrosine-type recombinase/integrase [Rugamonas apoptosis]|uniref:Integrase arm-type DNA-binding domain-containing protein n=1 Tax=Rugamonas apoptosis TaxID=2758570 RepID=A0A7W2FEK7_9BURK|nr:site-specific integrase [Rugamonas apoptosis]MBA5690283.1 integrase arm-type DNA-binding domain-containing protein [Rugamonas apoptosis]